ncbi:MAG: glycosyltransferase family 39 protein [Microthrixaceae bacterium]
MTTGVGDAPVVLESRDRRLTDSLDRLIGGRWRAAEAALYVLAAIAAWVVRFVQDDAFITYRYARNLARGQGLVFNEGERVEGYTNFLWTVMHWLPERLGWSTPVFSQVVGIVVMVAAVAVTLRLARRLFGSESFAFLVALTLLANMSFLAYATGGLETMQQTLLVTSVAALLLPVTATPRPAETARRVGAGLCAGLAILTRMDSAVLITVWVLAYLVAQWRRSRGAGNSVSTTFVAAVQIAGPAALLLLPWFIWKLSYYGNLLPNTFYAKSAGNPVVPLLYGLLYLAVFFFSYAAFLLIPRFLRLRHELFSVPGAHQVLAVVPVWCIYICLVGGDFMEFRFMVPIMPVLAMVAAFLINSYRRTSLQVLLVGTLLVVSAAHRPMPTLIPYPVLTFTELSHWPNESTTSWKGKGEFLAEQFPGGPDVEGQPKLAVAPLGVLPYFADLPTVDMLGLTDPVTARTGYAIEPYYPGHVRMARVEHLVDQGVNLVLAQPGSTAPEPGREAYRLSELTFLYPSVDLRALPDEAQVIEIPQIDGKVWLVIYLTPNDKVDAAIDQNGWNTYPIERTCVAEDMDVVEGSGPLVDFANRMSRMVGERTCPSA